MAEEQLVDVRDRLLDRMVERARNDSACASAALLGSAARGSGDEWSDIDFALRLVAGADVDQAAEDWASWIARHVEVADFFDIEAWDALYRVFFCANGLQIDLSLWPWDRFRAVNGEPIKLLFGDALEPDPVEPRPWIEDARMAWLYAIHARSAIHRGRALQADLMLSHWRDRVVSLAAIRHGLNASQGREAHLLPDDLQAAVTRVRPGSLEADELRRALGGTADLYLAELRRHDSAYASRLQNAVSALTR